MTDTNRATGTVTGKFTGPVDDTHYDNCMFDGATFHAVTFRNCTFTSPVFKDCTLQTVHFENCRILEPSFGTSTIRQLALFDTELVAPKEPLRADRFTTIKGSTLRDVVLRSTGSPMSGVGRLESTTISGQLEDIDFTEDDKQTQLTGVDLSQCTLTNVSFTGIPMDRVRLPESEQHLVDEHWAGKADELNSIAKENFDSDDVRLRHAAGQLFTILQREASVFRSVHNVGRPEKGSLGFDERRGARYVHELSGTAKPEWINKPMKTLYSYINERPAT